VFLTVVDYPQDLLELEARFSTEEKAWPASELLWKCAGCHRQVEWTPKLRQANKTHFSSNGELSYGSESTEVHAGV
jgi:hypothetical protein